MQGTCPVHGDKPCPEHNTHHLYWPRKSYRSKLERQFRRLYTVRICVEWHKHIHATTPAPKKPSAAAMRTAIEVKIRERSSNA